MTRKKTVKSSKKCSLTDKSRAITALRGKSFHGYEFVSLVDVRTKRSVCLGGNVRPAATLYRMPMHALAIEKAVKQGIFHYEWSALRGKEQQLYQTTCVALSPEIGKATEVLVLSRNITRGFIPYTGPAAGLRDSFAPRTFAQILLASRETEKREISKALHDEIGSSAVMLTALLSLVRANVQTGNTKQALRDLAQLDTQIKQGVERIKNIVVSLRPPAIENQGGLGGAVRDLLENVSALSLIPYTFDYQEPNDTIGVSDNVKILLYRVVQEALTNLVKHARAKHISVSLKTVGTRIRLTVCDDGVGFVPAKQLSIKQVGLLAMKDSVKLLGGKISVKSAPGKGTHIAVSCPRVVYGGKAL